MKDYSILWSKSLIILLIGFLLYPNYCNAWEPVGSLPYGPPNHILEAEGRIWVAGGGTIFGFDPDEGNSPPVDTIFVYGSLRDLDYHEGRLYITTDANGMFLYDISERPLRRLNHWMPPGDVRLSSCSVLPNGQIVVTGGTPEIVLLADNADSVVTIWTSQVYNAFSTCEVMGDLLLVEIGPYGEEYLLMDISDPAQPESLHVDGFGDWIGSFLPVDDTLCYVTAGLDGVYLMNYADPTEPEQIAHAPIMYEGSKAGPMSFDGEKLLVTHRSHRQQPEGGLGIYSAELDSLRWYRWTGGDVGAPLLREDEAWVLKAHDGIYSINLENLQRTYVNWLYRLPHQVEGVFVRDNLAYLAEGHGGLRIIDYSDPSSPHEIGWCDNEGLAEDIWIDGNHAYVADGNGLMIYHVSDPTQPDVVAHWTREQFGTDWVEGCVVEDDILYIAAHQKLLIGDVSDPADMQPLCEIETVRVKDVAVRDGIAYLPDQVNFSIIDCRDRRQPVRLADFEVPGNNAWDIALRDNLALVTDSQTGLHIFSIEDPENPELLSTVEFESCQGVDDDGYFTYVGLVWDGIAVVDISDPRRPEIVETFDTPGAVLNVKSDGEIVVAADYNAGTSYFSQPDREDNYIQTDILMPGMFQLAVYPNPFNSSSTIRFTLPRGDNVVLTLIDLTGRPVLTLLDSRLDAGSYRIGLNGGNLASGVYFVRLGASKQVVLKKTMLMK